MPSRLREPAQWSCVRSRSWRGKQLAEVDGVKTHELSEMRARVTALRVLMDAVAERLREQRSMVERLSRASGATR